MDVQSAVTEFHRAFGLPVATRPDLDAAPADVRELRRRLLAEEFDEYIDAERADDLVEVADALADMVYVAFGTALTYGIDLNAVLAEVHRSNMSKLGSDGRPVHRDDGKVLKGPEFFPPDVAGTLGLPEVPAAGRCRCARVAHWCSDEETRWLAVAGTRTAGQMQQVLDDQHMPPELQVEQVTVRTGHWVVSDRAAGRGQRFEDAAEDFGLVFADDPDGCTFTFADCTWDADVAV